MSKDIIRNKLEQKRKSAVTAFMESLEQQTQLEPESPPLTKTMDKEVERVNEVAETPEEKRKHASLESTIDNILFNEDEQEKVFRGFYLDEDVVKTIDKLASKKKKQKGFKSDLVNGILRSVLEDYGYLKSK